MSNKEKVEVVKEDFASSAQETHAKQLGYAKAIIGGAVKGTVDLYNQLMVAKPFLANKDLFDLIDEIEKIIFHSPIIMNPSIAAVNINSGRSEYAAVAKAKDFYSYANNYIQDNVPNSEYRMPALKSWDKSYVRDSRLKLQDVKKTIKDKSGNERFDVTETYSEAGCLKWTAHLGYIQHIDQAFDKDESPIFMSKFNDYLKSFDNIIKELEKPSTTLGRFFKDKQLRPIIVSNLYFQIEVLKAYFHNTGETEGHRGIKKVSIDKIYDLYQIPKSGFSKIFDITSKYLDPLNFRKEEFTAEQSLKSRILEVFAPNGPVPLDKSIQSRLPDLSTHGSMNPYYSLGENEMFITVLSGQLDTYFQGIIKEFTSKLANVPKASELQLKDSIDYPKYLKKLLESEE